MNKANLKSYAPQARKDFIAAVTARANLLGLSDKAGKLDVAASLPQGDVTVIAGQAWPVKVHSQREQLVTRIRKDGFAQTMEAVAYTWFNRFAALRYMELHDYLGHGHRALSSTAGTLPDILTHAADLAQSSELPGLKASRVTEMKLAGNRDGELYRMLLVSQCNALSAAMPFLFERIDDETELLLPDNLLRTDSVIAKLVTSIDEEDWNEVEIIGWLYQFYISERKDEVIGKVVKSEDIPAATQLFTPNWIVQYLVQNSVGRLWLMANPASNLKTQWPYYIEPAQQTPEVQAQLDALIQTRMDEDGGSLNPESITLLDPACGSGHILVEAYEVLKAIYLERGYQPRAIPRLILEKNLYGLDIDDRAAQMAGFALLMKARADDRRLFTSTDDAGNLLPPRLNVLSLQESKGLSVDELATHLGPFKLQRATITALVETFEHAKTFGSLIQIPYALKTHLAVLPEALALVKQSGDMYASAAADDLLPLVQQAQVLAMQFDAVAANPPYMGGKYLNSDLKVYIGQFYSEFDKDLFSAFMVRCLEFGRKASSVGIMTPFTWMFLSSFEALRNYFLNSGTISSLVKPSYTSFFESAIVSISACVLNKGVGFGIGQFFDLGYLGSAESQPTKFIAAIVDINSDMRHSVAMNDFKKIPGSPLAYWLPDKVRNLFVELKPFGSLYKVAAGMTTGNNAKFVRFWHEVSFEKIASSVPNENQIINFEKKWFPYNKGGDYRKWYGNNDYVVNWENNGKEIINSGRAYPRARNWYFKESITWSFISSSNFGARYSEPGAIFDMAGCSVFPGKGEILPLTGLLCSSVAFYFLKGLNPTVNFQVGNISAIPIPDVNLIEITNLVQNAIEISKNDWNQFESSKNFLINPLVSTGRSESNLSQSWVARCSEVEYSVLNLKKIEESNNAFFIDSFNLHGLLTPEVSVEQITLTQNQHFRYGGDLSDADRTLRFRVDTTKELLSYAIGCMMGRYSLVEPGLIYANAGNVGFDARRYPTFPADADGIVPLTDELWFEDDAASRIREFLLAVWGAETLAENMVWLATSLGAKASETPDETIRRYLAEKFYKDHLQTYKKRPIYWLFSSGKLGAFQALVYLQRYHEGTLARLRAEYVVPLTGKIQSRIDMLQKDAAAASSTAARNKLAKEVEKLKKKHVELLAYDEQLRHHADMRITLDLDDGVKVNYGKFGDLLAEVKVVTGGAGDE